MIVARILLLAAFAAPAGAADPSSVHTRAVEVILAAQTDPDRDRALNNALQFLQNSPDSRLGSTLNPRQFLQERYSDLLNAFMYSEVAATVAEGRAETKSVDQAKKRIHAAVERVFRDDGSVLLSAWSHSEEIQSSVSEDDIYRMMVKRLADAKSRFPKPSALYGDKVPTLGLIHVQMQVEARSIVSTEILDTIKSTPVFGERAQKLADHVLRGTRSRLERGLGACSRWFRKLGGG